MKIARPLLIALIANEVRGLCVVAMVLAGMAHHAQAQNAPLPYLLPRGTVQSTDLIPIMPANGTQLEQTTVAALAIGVSGATGTVTSVGLAMPAPFNCTGSPVTASGVITCTVSNQSANTVWAGPTSGGAATPAFRALVTADLPASGVTAGTYSTPTSVSVNAAGQVTGIIGGSCIVGCTPLNLANFTWINQGGATAAQPVTNGPIGLFIPDDGGTCCQWRGIVQNAPASTPWKVVVAMNAGAPLNVSATIAALIVYNGTKLVTWETGLFTAGFLVEIEHVSGVSSGGTPVFATTTGWGMFNAFQRVAYLQIRDDGTNLYFDTSPDGVVFYNHYSEAVGSYLTPTKIGVVMLQQQNASVPGYLGVLSFQTYADANLSGP